MVSLILNNFIQKVKAFFLLEDDGEVLGILW